jgi:hypothetical protein
MATFLAYHRGWEGRTFLILTYYLGTIIIIVVRMPSPIDWYHYTAYNLAVNPGDDYVFAEREVYRDRLSNLALEHGPTVVCHSTLGLVLLLYPSTA